jgi:hypothetical protein
MYNAMSYTLPNFISQESMELIGCVIEDMYERVSNVKQLEYKTFEMKEFLCVEIKLFEAYNEKNGNDVFFYLNELPEKFMALHREIDLKLRRKAPEQYKAVMMLLKYPEKNRSDIGELLGKEKSTVNRQLRNAGRKIS